MVFDRQQLAGLGKGICPPGIWLQLAITINWQRQADFSVADQTDQVAHLPFNVGSGIKLLAAQIGRHLNGYHQQHFFLVGECDQVGAGEWQPAGYRPVDVSCRGAFRQLPLMNHGGVAAVTRPFGIGMPALGGLQAHSSPKSLTGHYIGRLGDQFDFDLFTDEYFRARYCGKDRQHQQQ